MLVIQWWLTYFFYVASEPVSVNLLPTRQMLCRFIESIESGILLKLLSTSDLFRRNYI